MFLIGSYILFVLQFPILHKNQLFYFESMLLPFGAIVLFALLKGLDSIDNWAIKNSVLALVVVVGLINIYSSHGIFTRRLEWHQQINAHLQESNHTKFALDQNNLDENLLLFFWAIPHETLLYSKIYSPKQLKTINVCQDIEFCRQFENATQHFVDQWSWWDYKNLNQFYFKLPEEEYHLLTGFDSTLATAN